jgi:hypothetical protein
MIIDEFKRDEDNEVIAICGDVEIPLTAEYIAKHKPQIGEELVFEEPTVEK